MSYQELTFLHLGTVIPAFLIGTYLMLNRKGTGAHRALGRWCSTERIRRRQLSGQVGLRGLLSVQKRTMTVGSF